MQDFKSVADDFGGLVRSCRFAVRIKPQGDLTRGFIPLSRDLVYLCEMAELPARGFSVIDNIRYYGPGFALPVQSTYGDVSFTFMCRAASLEREMMDTWMSIINPTDTYDFRYRDDYRAEIDIFHFGEVSDGINYDAPEAHYCISLIDAYPVLVNAQRMTWADDQFQRLDVTFTFTKWLRKDIDSPARGTYQDQDFSFNLVEGIRPGNLSR